MKARLANIIRTKPIFLYLLPIFFVLHGFTENFDFVPADSALVLTGIYLIASLLISLLCWLLYRNFTKANLAAFLVMAFHFFFGVVHDLLKKIGPGSFLGRYSFILTISAILLITAFILIKRNKSGFKRTRFYLNSLLLLLLLLDTGLLLVKIMGQKKETSTLPTGFTQCQNCPKPDIYFILLDEYAGETELKDIFQFDNTRFYEDLKSRGFHTIRDSYSNYNYTPFSVASILNMEWLNLSSRNISGTDLIYCYEKIKENRLLHFLQSHGYIFYNYSVFDFNGQPKRVMETFLPAKTRLITSQTFIDRFNRDLRFNLWDKLGFKSDYRLLTYHVKKNNENIIDLTNRRAVRETASPKFIYAHLMMPHYPYYFDSKGNEQPFEKLVGNYLADKGLYLEYLQYSNKIILGLVDHIQKSSKAPSIIILMGDHGFRHFEQPVEQKYYFLNLTSVYLPSSNYGSFKDSTSSVNFFRTLLNTEFRQQLPYLKDSTSYLKVK